MITVKEPLAGPSLSPPPCSAEHPQDRDLSKDSTTNVTQHRCQFTYSDGRRCSNERAPLCAHHAAKQKPDFGAIGAPDAALEGLCSDLTTATNINRALAHVFLLTAQGRISQKQAVAFGYLSQLLLQTVPGIRSEFVSAFGYHPWEQKLKASLESNHNEDPDDSGSSRESLLAANVYHPPQKGYQQDALFAGDKVELRGVKEDQELSRVNKVRLKSSLEPQRTEDGPNDEPDDPAGAGETPQQRLDKSIVDRRPFEERVMEPDYDSIVSRGRDLLAGKYSVTPEGRREAQALNTELELMQPPAAKMPKGARASVIEHMKRWIAQKKKPAAKRTYPANMPPPLNMLGHPIPMAVPYDELERGAQSASRTPSRAADFATPTPSRETSPPADKLSPPPKSEISDIKSPVVPVSPPSSRTSTVSPDRPPTHRPKKRRPSTQVPAPEPSPRPSPPAFAPELALASNPPNSTAHATDWYTPPAWSKNRASDPFPNRNEKRKREFRGMSNSKLRHLQHLNSRAF